MRTITRFLPGVIGAASVVALAMLAVFCPPDGRERGDWAQFLGALHPLAVHLPIALLLLVPVLETAGRRESRAHLRSAAGFVLALGSLSALVAPALGWLLGWSGGYDGDVLRQHMWGGIAVAAGSVLSWATKAAVRPRGNGASSRLYLVPLTITLFVLFGTGYRGGQLAHGPDHLTEHLPASLQAWLGEPGPESSSAEAATTFYDARIAPIFKRHCVSCHGRSKHKGGLRLDSYEQLMSGGDGGAVIHPGSATSSELYRRVSLDPSSKGAMPASGKPPLEEPERQLLQAWIDAGAAQSSDPGAIDGAPADPGEGRAAVPDYRADAAAIASLQETLGIRLVPRSQDPADGLVLRTASAPSRCDDAVIARLQPVARYIVEAELARTAVTDAGLESLATFDNLRSLDLSHTSVSSAGMAALARLPQLQTLNLTATGIDDAGVEALRTRPTLRRLYVFGTRVKTHAADPTPGS